MNRKPHPSAPALGALVGTAFLLWAATFAWPVGSFWLKISLAAGFLAAVSLRLRPRPLAQLLPGRSDLLAGAAGAALLYVIFWAGREVSLAVFDFAGGQIEGIYRRGDGTPAWVIAGLLLLVTGPAEEIYWRGTLQEALMARFGRLRGWAAAGTLYAAVHAASGNFMLVGAAAVAGAFWGGWYAWGGRLPPVIVSHALWSSVVFTALPLR